VACIKVFTIQEVCRTQKGKQKMPHSEQKDQLWLSLTGRYIAGCISYMPLVVSVNMVAECLRTDCNILGDKEKRTEGQQNAIWNAYLRLWMDGGRGRGYYYISVLVIRKNVWFFLEKWISLLWIHISKFFSKRWWRLRLCSVLLLGQKVKNCNYVNSEKTFDNEMYESLLFYTY